LSLVVATSPRGSMQRAGWPRNIAGRQHLTRSAAEGVIVRFLDLQELLQVRKVHRPPAHDCEDLCRMP
jgi:hypothetical protein